MPLKVILKKENECKKAGKYNYGTSTGDIGGQNIRIDLNTPLKLWLNENGTKDSKISIYSEDVNKYEIKISKSGTKEWELTLTKEPVAPGKHEENANHHGCVAEPPFDSGATVTIGEP